MTSTELKPAPPQVLDGIANEAYHAAPGEGSSMLKLALQSPMHYHHAKTHPKERVPSPQMVAGTLAHCAVLEPDEFDKRYVVLPDDAPNRPTDRQRGAAKPSPATIEAVKWWDDWTAKTNGAEVITAEQRSVAMAQAASVRAHPEAARLLKRGRAEVSAWAIDPETGLVIKCRPDFVSEGWGVSQTAEILVDLKTSASAAPDDFARSVWNFGYHLQDTHYRQTWELATGKAPLGLVFVVVESAPPHATATYMLDADALQRGARRRRQALQLIKDCTQAGTWPGYGTDMKVLSLPGWAQRKDDDDVN